VGKGDPRAPEPHVGQESTLPQKDGPRPPRRPRASLLWGVLALLVLVASSSGVVYWQKLGPSNTGATPRATLVPTPTPTSDYVYVPPTTRGGTITVHLLAADPPGWDNPWGISEQGPALFGFPFIISPTGQLLPDELTELPTQANGDVSNDGLTVIMRLRPDLKWSDGQPLTAEDFKYWLDVLFDPASGFFHPDTGILDGFPLGIALIASSQVQDAHTLVLRYKQLNVSYLFSLPWAAPKHLWGSIPDQDLFQRDDVVLYPKVTSGPFMPVVTVPGQYMILVPNPNYASTTLHQSVLNTLIIKFYPFPQGTDAEIAAFEASQEAGQSDFAEGFFAGDLPKLSTLPGYHISHDLDYDQLSFNLSLPALQDDRVRQAMEEAIDRCGLIETIFATTCANLRVDTILPSPSPFYDRSITTFGYDLAQAKMDMQAAGWDCTSGVCMKDGHPFPLLRLVTTNYKGYRHQAAERIEQNLKDLGILVEITTYSYDEFFGDYKSGGILRTGQYDLALFDIGFGIDPDEALYNLFHSSQIPSARNVWGGNVERVKDPTIDNQLDQGRSTLNLDRRTQLYQDLQLLLVKGVYLIPLYLEANITLVNANIGNEQDNGVWGNLWNVSDWFLKTGGGAVSATDGAR
jgi:peptide/nickel transport system substrate-binding protein